MFTFLEDGGCSVKVEDLHQLWNNLCIVGACFISLLPFQGKSYPQG